MSESSAVFITGAAGGVGTATVHTLVASGMRVYAGVRSESQTLHGIPGVEQVRCDVTDAEQIAAAAGYIAEKEGTGGLRAVINNAGLIVQGPVELMPIAQWRSQLDVNVVGPAMVTQAFLPLLRLGQGRVVNISASTGRVPFPFWAPLSASKAALDSFSAAARMELSPWRIPVIVVEPSAMQTAIFDKAALAAKAVFDTVSGEQQALYGRQLEKLATTLSKQTLASPELVAKVITRAVNARRPKRRYVAGRDARMAGVLSHLPSGLRSRVLIRALGLTGISFTAA